jgi:sulfopyruvate decarboxylase subunit alpha
MSTTTPVAEALFAAGIDFTATLPDSWIHKLLLALEADRRCIHVPLAKEEEGVGICAGAWLTGRIPALIIQNSGLLNCCNALTTLNGLYDIPLLLLVSYRGTMEEESFFHVPLGSVTEPVLDSLGIPYRVVSQPDEIFPAIANATSFMRTSQRPTAVLMTRGSLTQEEDR